MKQIIKTVDGKFKGKITRGSRLCSCGSQRLGVRWSDNKLTWICVKDIAQGKFVLS